MTTRRFPPPWTVEDIGAAFVVRDHDGQQLAYVISRMSRGVDRRRNCLARTPGSQSKLMTTVWASKDANFAVATRHRYDSH
jgi:hypothetical protein